MQQRFSVKPHIDEELDKRTYERLRHHYIIHSHYTNTLCDGGAPPPCPVRELYSGLPDLLTRVAHEELERLPGLSECNVTYLPQVNQPTAREPGIRTSIESCTCVWVYIYSSSGCVSVVGVSDCGGKGRGGGEERMASTDGPQSSGQSLFSHRW